MMSTNCPALPKRSAEWRHSGPFLLLAVALHGVALAYPLPQRLTSAPPLTLTATLNERSAAVVAVAPTPAPASQPVAPRPPSRKAPARPEAVMASPQASPESPKIFASPLLAAPVISLAPAVTNTNSQALQTANAAAPLSAARFDAAYLNNPRPNYPSLSRRLGEEGKVLLRVRVGTDGQPLTVKLEKSSEFARLDEAALQVVGHWRFIPARRGDEAVETSVIVPIVFQLES